MANKWNDVPIEEVKDPSAYSIAMGPFGSNIKTDNFVLSGVPIIRGVNLNADRFLDDSFVFLTEEKADELRSANAYPGDLVFTHRGTLGQVGIIPRNAKYRRYVVSQSQMKLRCNPDKADPNFVFYFFKSPQGQHALLANTSTTGVPAISSPLTTLRAIRIPLPPLPEQHAIAGILGALDDKIELNRRRNATLESMARAVFRKWFVEGEEVGNWEIGRLGDFIKVNERSITKDYSHDEIEYIDISSVSLGHSEGTTAYSLTDSPSRAKRLVQHGDTIWSTVRPNRKSYLFISNPKENLVVSTGFAVLTPKKVPPSFLYFLTTTEQFVDYLVSNADGSAYPAVLPERFADAEFSIPPESVLDRFESIASPMLSHIAYNENESRTLASLRDALLPRLISGEIRIKGGEYG